jgi:restriction system protein
MNLNRLQRMDPIAFERFVGELFKKMGYRVEDTRASADEGIDLVLRRGRGMAVVQCKRYSGSVGQPVVRDLYGVMLHTKSTEAYLVTTGTITQAAYRWAEGKPIHLVDGHRLVEWTRTGRLNYDQRPQLGRRRPWLWLGLAALFLIGSILVGTPAGSAQLQNWQQNIQGIWPNEEQAAVEATATPSPHATAEALPDEGEPLPTPEPSPAPFLEWSGATGTPPPSLDSSRPAPTPGIESTRAPIAPPGGIPLPDPVDPES